MENIEFANIKNTLIQNITQHETLLKNTTNKVFIEILENTILSLEKQLHLLSLKMKSMQIEKEVELKKWNKIIEKEKLHIIPNPNCENENKVKDLWIHQKKHDKLTDWELFHYGYYFRNIDFKKAVKYFNKITDELWQILSCWCIFVKFLKEYQCKSKYGLHDSVCVVPLCIYGNQILKYEGKFPYDEIYSFKIKFDTVKEAIKEAIKEAEKMHSKSSFGTSTFVNIHGNSENTEETPMLKIIKITKNDNCFVQNKNDYKKQQKINDNIHEEQARIAQEHEYDKMEKRRNAHCKISNNNKYNAQYHYN